MHPNSAYRSGDRALQETLIDQVGIGMVFAQTSDGPRVAHTPLLSTGDGAVQFHLSRGNALAKHLIGQTALLVVNGPDAYVSARWYEDRNTVPTWNFIALELEGPVRGMEAEGTLAMLENLSRRHEGRAEGGKPWSMAELTDERKRKLVAGIVGFEMEVFAWRDTIKLSQDDSAGDRARIAEGLQANGSHAIAELMRTLVSDEETK
ncbi:FMN-binding negative transcriptional regulator [Pontixanthobacter gangjinensis]|uniref:FMN-binding negative transcriptional regulator n=1 Tax=Pontixanthobacter gangjinensis TaxID=1028742 RepID=A0A6I4SKW8_9SPHN|nr:FMN-binding negative transcriptional regulator [Pontixanthobacter gangjinensis]MXO56353.1 FMN-binding negative transcriptional regulator [Pontixanthobacter gangjinensis]